MNLSLWIWGAGMTCGVILLLYCAHELYALSDRQLKFNKGVTDWLVELDVRLMSNPQAYADVAGTLTAEGEMEDFFGEEEAEGEDWEQDFYNSEPEWEDSR